MPGQTKSRAEAIRRRRLAETRPAQPSSSRNRKPRSTVAPPPPVMARTPLTGGSRPVSKTAHAGRRLYSVSLNRDQGAEMRLPAAPRLVLSWRLVSFLIVGLFGFALYYFWESPNFQVAAPEISGLRSLTPNLINSEVEIVGQPVFMLDANTIRTDLLESFPELVDAEVVVEFPNTVWITVTERTPVLGWVQAGERFLVDEQGMTFPSRTSVDIGGMPVIEAAGDPPLIAPLETSDPKDVRAATIGKITGVLLPQLAPQDQVKPLISPQMVEAILLLADQAPDGAKLIYEPVHGLGWLDRRGWKVFLGKEADLPLKLQIYRSILEELKRQENRPTMISVEYPHAPYFRLEE